MNINTKSLGLTDYANVFYQMKDFTLKRSDVTDDELWFTQHYPVFTQGQSGSIEHIVSPNSIQLVQSDRGGKATYHGPGQLVLYFLIDIKRRNIGVRKMVTLIEQTIIDTLAEYKINAESNPDAPGVYVAGEKIASLGLRVRGGKTYHGASLNIDMDLTPFTYINPCGNKEIKMTMMKSYLDEDIEVEDVASNLINHAKSLVNKYSCEKIS